MGNTDIFQVFEKTESIIPYPVLPSNHLPLILRYRLVGHLDFQHHQHLPRLCQGTMWGEIPSQKVPASLFLNFLSLNHVQGKKAIRRFRRRPNHLLLNLLFHGGRRTGYKNAVILPIPFFLSMIHFPLRPFTPSSVHFLSLPMHRYPPLVSLF